MAKKSLYEIAAVWHGKDDDKVVVEPQEVLAIDRPHAELIAARKIPAEYDDKLDEVEISVKPF